MTTPSAEEREGIEARWSDWNSGKTRLFAGPPLYPDAGPGESKPHYIVRNDVPVLLAALDTAADARRKAAEEFLAYNDERDEYEAAGDYMQIRFGGDTGRSEDWLEAHRVARLVKRPQVPWTDRALVAEAERDALAAQVADLTSRLVWHGGGVR